MAGYDEDFNFSNGWNDVSDWGTSDYGDWSSIAGWDQPIDFGAFSQPGGTMPWDQTMDMQSFSQMPFNPALMQGMGQTTFNTPGVGIPGMGPSGVGPMTSPGMPGGGVPVPAGANTPLMPGGGGMNVPGAPGAAGPQGLLQQLMTPQGMLGAGGTLAGILGAIAGGGKGATATPNMMPQARAAGTQTDAALYNLNPLAMGTNPLQMQQNALLASLGNGQGLPPGYAQLVEQAFQPQMGNIATQAIESARRRGFAGGAELLQQGPAGAIAGPALADLQGQMAQAKLGLMQTLPQLYNTPIANQTNAASNVVSGYNNLMRSYPTGQTQSQPLGSQIGAAVGAGLQGLGQGIAQNQQNENLNKILSGMMGGATGQRQQPGGLGYAPTEY